MLLFVWQLGEWVFVASGTGLLPQPQDPTSVYTGTGTNTTLIIPFRNPMDTAVLATVVLKGRPGLAAGTLALGPCALGTCYIWAIYCGGLFTLGPFFFSFFFLQWGYLL